MAEPIRVRGSRAEVGVERLPVLFLSHGAPTLAVDPVRGPRLAAWGQTLPRPRALLVISAHWNRTPARLGTLETHGLIYDFGGFDQALKVTYPAPGAPELAARVAELLPGVATDGARGWDHGVWVPLVHLFPEADVPLLQLSLPGGVSFLELVELGQALAPLRDEGVLLIGSGGAVHNLGALDWSDAAAPSPWALEFEAWLREALVARDRAALLDVERRPGFRHAHPTPEHLQPLYVALGASDPADELSFPVEGWEYGSLSHLSVQFG
ncbi:MAG: class III extradiol ring-cleavage dioxygenase [Planctomycetota bacterium]